MAELATASPSNCNYCYTLECSVRIESTSTIQKRGAITAKNAIVTVGRNSQREIILQVEITGPKASGNPAVASYALRDCRVHQQGIGKGKGGIEVPLRKLVIHMNNCPPRKLNVFLKSLQAKLDLMKSEESTAGKPSTALRTPVSIARSRIFEGLPNVFNVLSPLSIAEIRQVRRLRGVATGDSPVAKDAKSVGSPKVRTTLTEVQSSTPKASKRFSNGEIKSRFDPTRVILSDEQRKVVRAVVQNGANVFFTGSAGSGKSVILKRIIEMLPASTSYITAATGVAACQIGGITLHSFAGIGLGTGTPENCVKIVTARKPLVKQWKLCTHLIIDEISMVDPIFFTNIEYVARSIRCDDRPFGGIQLIITGDFLQLPPVTKDGDEPKFCFETEAWSRTIQKTILLKEVKRQDDQQFVSLLQNVRIGKCTIDVINLLTKTKENNFSEKGIIPTKLCTHTADAEKINAHCLKQLEGDEKLFVSDDSQHIPEYVKSIVAGELVLKIGAQVMLTKNMDLGRGLSNGSRGVVRSYSKNGLPLVKFVATEEEIEIRPSCFSVRVPHFDEPVMRKQLPLQLAWAISIHKSQGLTLDAVEMSLSKVFADGQSYVALSRARNLASIRVIGFDPACIRANKRVVRFYQSLAEDGNIDDSDNENGFVIRRRSRFSL